MRRLGRRTLLGLLLGLLAAGGAVGAGCGYAVARLALGTPPFSNAQGSTFDLMLPMHDGVRLHTEVFLPDGDGPWPTLLVRNPYNMADWFGTICRFFNRYGYACVHQDVRGRQQSEGEWDPLVNERADGLETLDWLLSQPFQDGNIALFGMSYLGAVQWTVADALPPEVKTLIPMVISTHMRQAIYQRGMFRHEVFTLWAALMPNRGLNILGGRAYQAAIRHYPPIEVDERYFGRRLPWFRVWQTSEDAGAPLWQGEAFQQLLEMPTRVRVPVLMIGAWYDLFTGGEIDDFSRLASRGRSKLIVGPWCHLQTPSGDFPLPGDVGLGGQLNVILDWLDHHLRGAPLKRGRGFVKTYAMGEGVWRNWDQWPPETREETWYFSGRGNEGGCVPGGLEPDPVDTVGRFEYDYDPLDPVPTRGGGPLLAFAIPGFGGKEPGSVLQPDVCARPDVISFLSEPLESDLHVAGAIRVTVHVASSAFDSAFTAKVSAVFPDGEVYNIRDSIASLVYRAGEEARAYTPGTIVPVEITMWPIEWVLKRGTRIRVDISSSNFPAYHAHANRAGPWALQTDPISAHQKVFVGGEFPSRVVLPVWEGRVPGGAFDDDISRVSRSSGGAAD